MYHLPVMLNECIEALDIKPDGVYVDVTFGGGGHSKLILEKLGDNGRLFGFDQDPDAYKNRLDDDRFTFIQHNFRFLKQFLRLEGVRKVDGILADLGVSSHQLNEAERGFSYRFEADLDMRMNREDGKSAIDVVNNYTQDELQSVFSKYGEVRNSKTLAMAIVEGRMTENIRTIQDFINIIKPAVRGKEYSYYSRAFQALRIEVNQEIEVLESFMEQCGEVIAEKGRLVVLSYHSLEDRIAKNYIKKGSFDGVAVKDHFGNLLAPFKAINNKPLLPTSAEISQNPRARSAKLRIAEKR